MATEPQAAGWYRDYPSLRYILPFAFFILLLAAFPKVTLAPAIEGSLWLAVMAVVCWTCWPRDISLVPSQPLAAIGIGAAVFLLWIAPDLLIPGYRDTILFSNSVVGHVHSSLSPTVFHSPWLLTLRTLRAVVIVPIVEELFWRGWMMRWLINTDFRSVPLGTYSPLAFWVTAILFASEHGPYWDVGLVTGIIYNAWMIRSKSIASCILMHAITNGILCAYVIATSQWQYWQ